MIAAFDVHYYNNGLARAAAILFNRYSAAEVEATHTAMLSNVADYLPGSFYLRELPCILHLLEQVERLPTEMIVDGYVMLGDRPGLGRHLFDAFNGGIPVIGVAKNHFAGTECREVLRGKSRKPLYITAAGVEENEAAARVQSMHGAHRIPTLLKKVDLLARGH